MAGTVIVEGDQLVFEVSGVDEILSIKRRLAVPMDRVVSVSTEAVGWNPFRQLKVAGTDIPGVVKDGRYVTGDGLVFFEMHHTDRCITVTLDHETYKKVVFEVEDKEATAKLIEDALARRK